MSLEIAEKHTILRAISGSGLYGTSLGEPDRDEVAVFVEPPENVCGLTPLDVVTYRTAGQGERSKPGDLDLALYSLRKFVRLAIKGNPQSLELLFAPSHLVMTDVGAELVALRQTFICKEAGYRYLGYLESQRAVLCGEKNKKLVRPDLVERYGYDTKFAMHALRLAWQGLEVITARHLTLPFDSWRRSHLLKVRAGEFTLSEVLAEIASATSVLRFEVDRCPWTVSQSGIDAFLVHAHRRHWAASS